MIASQVIERVSSARKTGKRPGGGRPSFPLANDHRPEAASRFGQKLTVMVTGVSGYWGQRLVRNIEQNPCFDRVLGLDYVDPLHPFQKCEFIPIDLLNPLLSNLLQTERVNVVCHLLFVPTRSYREEIFKLNVLGTVRLLSACARAGVSRIVLKSSTLVYGASANSPFYMKEEDDLGLVSKDQYIRDLVDIEGYCSTFLERHQEVSLSILRFANVLGSTVDTSMTRYLSRPVVPVAMGFDPLMQLVHEDDVVSALSHALSRKGARGVFNVAAAGAAPLSKIVRRVGRSPVPLPASLLRRADLWLRRSGVNALDRLETPFLQFPCTASTTRMEKLLGFRPARDLHAVLDSFRDLGDLKADRYQWAGNHSERLQIAIRSARRKTL